MPSASPTKISARPAVSGFSATAAIAAPPTTATAYAAPSAARPATSAAEKNAHFMTSGDVVTSPFLCLYGLEHERLVTVSAAAKELAEELVVLETQHLDGHGEAFEQDG